MAKYMSRTVVFTMSMIYKKIPHSVLEKYRAITTLKIMDKIAPLELIKILMIV